MLKMSRGSLSPVNIDTMKTKSNNANAGLVALKSQLRAKGWTSRAAAKEVGVTPTHFCLVLNGQRASARLIARMRSLPSLTGMTARKIGRAER